jgi:hypothetical protein
LEKKKYPKIYSEKFGPRNHFGYADVGTESDVRKL